MRRIESLAARFPLVCCCCDSSEGDGNKEGTRTMELAPTFQLWRKNTGVAPAIGRTSVGAASPQRLPSTRLSTGRAVSPAPSVVSSLLTTDPTILRSERRDLAFTVGVKVIPHPEKVAKGGEDAYFISSYAGGVLGVADGVSGWAEENVDPALFSKELMAHARAAVETEEVGNDPRQLLAKAHSSTVSIGAATAIVAILEKNGILHVANVGDCGLRILRQGKVVYATKPQQHYFDCPYQLSSENAQTADDATVYELGVSEGDTIVMGSDGLFDNVYDSEIESTMQTFGGLLDEDMANSAALSLATLACKHAKDTTYYSPYAKEAILQGQDLPWWYKLFGRRIGGKIDDITVVVGHIVSTPVSSEDEVMSEKQEETSVVEREQAFAEERISLEQQISTNEQISAEEQVSTENQIPVQDQVSTKEQQIPVGEQVSTEEQISLEQQISTNEQISAEEEVSTEDQIPVQDQVSTKEQQIPVGEQVSTEEQISLEQQISTNEEISAEEQVSTEDQIPLEEQVSTEEQIPAPEQVSTKEQISEEPESQVS